MITLALTINGTISAFFNFQVLLTSFFRSWYFLIFLISVALSPKSLGTETSINNADFSSFVFEHHVRMQCFVCNVHTWRDHLVIREHYMFIFKDWIWFVFSWLFWDWDVEMFLDVPVDYFPVWYSIICTCLWKFVAKWMKDPFSGLLFSCSSTNLIR